ncbi:hypothetical protein AAHA92_11532 [Salvia divinorum]|uniref:Uncharacterized protein n=1 Tax=Salvia divinorum TaxID=28513 RepID=A0ABD1HHB2_SALDI
MSKNNSRHIRKPHNAFYSSGTDGYPRLPFPRREVRRRRFTYNQSVSAADHHRKPATGLVAAQAMLLHLR